MTEKQLRELDAWIAEHVMGAKHHTEGWSPGDTYEGGLDCLVSEWRPTTDPAAAMAVLEKCAERTKDLPCLYLGKLENEWLIGIEEESVEAIADTLPLAICLFARKLFGKEKP